MFLFFDGFDLRKGGLLLWDGIVSLYALGCDGYFPVYEKKDLHLYGYYIIIPFWNYHTLRKITDESCERRSFIPL